MRKWRTDARLSFSSLFTVLPFSPFLHFPFYPHSHLFTCCTACSSFILSSFVHYSRCHFKETHEEDISNASTLSNCLCLFSYLAVRPAYGQEAKQLYEQTCAMCHGPEGKGDGPNAQVLLPKPANLAVVLKDKDTAYLTKLLKGGGSSVGKSPLMPAYEGILKDEQIRDLIKYVKGFVAS